jgi:hypothetical protein
MQGKTPKRISLLLENDAIYPASVQRLEHSVTCAASNNDSFVTGRPNRLGSYRGIISSPPWWPSRGGRTGAGGHPAVLGVLPDVEGPARQLSLQASQFAWWNLAGVFNFS